MGLQSLTASHTFMEIIGSSLQLEAMAIQRESILDPLAGCDGEQRTGYCEVAEDDQKDTKSAHSNLE